MSDYPRDAPAQQLLLISAAPTEQPAIIDLNAAALHFGIPLGTTSAVSLLPVVCLRP